MVKVDEESEAVESEELEEEDDEDDEDGELGESERDERLDVAEKWKGSRKRRKLDAAQTDTDDNDGDAPFACSGDLCSRRFKSVPFISSHSLPSLLTQSFFQASALETHTSLKHGVIAPTPRPSRGASKPSSPAAKAASLPLLDLLIGTNYSESRKYPCPYPSILSISQPLEDEDLSDADAPTGEEGAICAYRFGRAYDVDRHLRSWHRVEVHRDELREWLEKD